MYDAARPNRFRLFRQLAGAERTEQAYRQLAAATIAYAHGLPADDEVGRSVAIEQAERLQTVIHEMQDETDHCRDAIIEAGYTPDQYEQWLTNLTNNTNQKEE